MRTLTKLLTSIFACIILSSCDPVGDLAVEIQNASSQDVRIQWFSQFEELSYDRTITQGETQRITEQDIQDIGGTPIEPYYQEFDSIVVYSIQNQILKVWRPDSPTKNIYNTSSDWQLTNIDKWANNARFVINDSDLDPQ